MRLRPAELLSIFLSATLPLYAAASKPLAANHLAFMEAEEDTAVPTDMRGLRAEHPRLFFTDADVLKIRQKIGTDSFAESEYEHLLVRGEAWLATPPNAYRMLGPDATLIATARDIEDRVLTLAGIYRITGDRRFADRAIEEMLSAAAFPDWNPHHFLDTAELSAALGIGYDWLYPVLTPQQRRTIRQAVAEKGIDIFLGRLHRQDVHYRNNWGQVCYGGMTVGALGIAEPGDKESLDRAKEMVGYARPGMAILMQLFAPDGGFEEGPVYWNYATIYNVLYIAALDSALGTDFHSADARGFNLTPEYRIQSLGPILQYANFSDASPGAFPAPQMYWFARRFHRPDYAAFEQTLTKQLRGKMQSFSEKESARFGMLGLFWYALGPIPQSKTLPLVKSFSRISQAFLRNSWNNSNAWYVAVKGGEANASHGHLDLGNFILDGLGKRWAIDLGAESYGMPGYFGAQRWRYYRAQTQGHNTLTIDGPNEDSDASAVVERAEKQGSEEIAVINLDKSYKKKLRSWQRRISIVDGKRVLVEDEIAPLKPVDIVWHFHTRAKLTIASDERTALLSQGGIKLEARILSPEDAHFGTASAQPSPPQAQNPGVTDLVILQSQVSNREMIGVMFSDESDSHPVTLEPLSDRTR